MTAIKSVVADAKRIVIKVGTALLTDNGRGLDEKAIANLAEELSAVQKLGREVVLVSSGSIAEGVRRLGWERRLRLDSFRPRLPWARWVLPRPTKRNSRNAA
jgi:glutamate 5-kinase